MATPSINISESPLVLYALRRADDALILGHRVSEWCGHAPMMEEDMALANMGLDLIGQARELYTYAAKVEARAMTKTNTRICATSASIATCCWSSSRTATLRAPLCGSSFIQRSPILTGAR